MGYTKQIKWMCDFCHKEATTEFDKVAWKLFRDNCTPSGWAVIYNKYGLVWRVACEQCRKDILEAMKEIRKRREEEQKVVEE